MQLFGEEGEYFHWPLHKLVGTLGIVLLVLYSILAIGYAPFHLIASRFTDILFAVTKDFALSYLLIPIYINWLSTDYFQERRKTSLGNAATNGFTGLWVGFDWGRVSYQRVMENGELLVFAGKLFFIFLMFLYSVFVIKEAVRGRQIAHIIGRVREVSYVAIMLTPIMYGVVPLDLSTIIAAIVFYPLFYGLIEFVEYFILPEPVSEKEELGETEEEAEEIESEEEKATEK